MKHIFKIVFLLLLACGAYGQNIPNTTLQQERFQNVLKNPGFENGKADWVATGGTFQITTVSPILGAQSASYDASATGQFLRSSIVNTPFRDCMASASYSSGDTSLRLRVLDGSNALIAGAEKILSSAAGIKTDKIYFPCASQARIEILASADASVVVLDRVQIGEADIVGIPTSCTDPLLCTNEFSAKVSSGRVVSGENVNWINGNAGGSGGTFTLTLNTLGLTTGMNCTLAGDNNAREQYIATTTTTITLGQYLTSSGAADGSGGFHIHCQKAGVDFKGPDKVPTSIVNAKCPNDLACADEISFKVSATGAVSDDDLDGVNGNCTNANPFVCTFNTGVFNNTPTCSVDAAAGLGRIADFTVSNTGISILTITDAGSLSQAAFHVRCKKAGSDYKPKQAITGYLSNTPYSAATNKITISSGYGGASATANCTTNPCTLYNSDPAITSISRSAAGTYQINFASGTFATGTIPNCTVTPIVSGGSYIFDTNAAPTVTTYNFRTFVYNTGVPGDSYGSVFCTGTRP